MPYGLEARLLAGMELPGARNEIKPLEDIQIPVAPVNVTPAYSNPDQVNGNEAPEIFTSWSSVLPAMRLTGAELAIQLFEPVV